MQTIWEDEKIICYQEGNLQYLQFKKLLQYPEITHCYTLRSGNELDFAPLYKDEKKYRQSCQKICECLNKNRKEQQTSMLATCKLQNEENSSRTYEEKIEPSQIVKPHQTHTNKVECVNKVEKLENVDGILTNQKNLVLLTTSADCTSLLFYDPIKKVIGSVHSGWKGTLNAICKNAVKKMIEQYQSSAKDIICCICPSIRKCCFEVDEDVKELFYQEYKELEEIATIIQKTQIKEGKQKYVIDTTKINTILLKQMGLRQENIIDSNLCTVCHSDKFHSYRVDKELSGRNGAILSLRDVY